MSTGMYARARSEIFSLVVNKEDICILLQVHNLATMGLDCVNGFCAMQDEVSV